MKCDPAVSAPADSREDAWPRWITNQFKGIEPSEVRAERGGAKVKPWRTLQPELTIRCVCQNCNNGWMSALEQAVRPFLQPLLRGQACVIPISGQAIISVWAVKTAMVLEALDPIEKRAYTQADCARLRERASIPWRTPIWLAASVDPAWFMSTKSRHLGPGMQGISGVSTTMAFGHIGVQVLTMNVPDSVGPNTEVTTDVRRGPWDQITTQVWPPRSAFNWPPPMGVQGEGGLAAFADRFSAADHKGEIDPIAV